MHGRLPNIEFIRLEGFWHIIYQELSIYRGPIICLYFRRHDVLRLCQRQTLLLICVKLGWALSYNSLAVVQNAETDQTVSRAELAQIEHQLSNDCLGVDEYFAVRFVRLICTGWWTVHIVRKTKRQMPNLIPIITHPKPNFMESLCLKHLGTHAQHLVPRRNIPRTLTHLKSCA